MGLAIIVPSISFEDVNLGKITLSGNVPIRGLYINLEEFYTGTEVDLKCSYLPANTTQRNVVWSIESGSEYASISGSALTILSGALNNDVTIKCTSASNPNISAEKTIKVTYSGGGSIIPDYTILRTYNTGVITQRIHPSDTPVNLNNYIVFMDFTQITTTTPDVSNRTIYSYIYNTSDYSYMNGYGIRDYNADNNFYIVYFAGQAITRVTEALVTKKVAFKVLGESVSYTLDGNTWTPINVSLRLDGDFAYGGKIIGTLRIDFYNNVNLDISSLFNA